jgi:hypothetical protein
LAIDLAHTKLAVALKKQTSQNTPNFDSKSLTVVPQKVVPSILQKVSHPIISRHFVGFALSRG